MAAAAAARGAQSSISSPFVAAHASAREDELAPPDWPRRCRCATMAGVSASTSRSSAARSRRCTRRSRRSRVERASPTAFTVRRAAVPRDRAVVQSPPPAAQRDAHAARPVPARLYRRTGPARRRRRRRPEPSAAPATTPSPSGVWPSPPACAPACSIRGVLGRVGAVVAAAAPPAPRAVPAGASHAAGIAAHASSTRPRLLAPPSGATHRPSGDAPVRRRRAACGVELRAPSTRRQRLRMADRRARADGRGRHRFTAAAARGRMQRSSRRPHAGPACRRRSSAHAVSCASAAARDPAPAMRRRTLARAAADPARSRDRDCTAQQRRRRPPRCRRPARQPCCAAGASAHGAARRRRDGAASGTDEDDSDIAIDGRSADAAAMAEARR